MVQFSSQSWDESFYDPDFIDKETLAQMAYVNYLILSSE